MASLTLNHLVVDADRRVDGPADRLYNRHRPRTSLHALAAAEERLQLINHLEFVFFIILSGIGDESSFFFDDFFHWVAVTYV